MADLRLTTSVDDRPGAEQHERRLSKESVASDPFGDRLLSGRYQVRACIGTGASATVHLATDVTLGRPVAVKILHEGLARDDAFLRRFQAEARSAAALNHPHITAVFDWGETDDDIPFLVMEHLAGGSLRTLLDQHGPRSPSQTLVIGLEAARGLDYAHRRGFVHRDVKPANLLFDDEARLRIADFGLARALAEAAWTEPADAVLGTAKYASPEQAMGDQLDGRSDVYALALVLHECLTGAVPFAADTSVGTLMSRIGKVFPAPEGSGPLGELVVWAAAPEPADRPTAGELATALAGISSQLDRPAPLPIVMTSTLGADLATVEPPDDLTVVGPPPAPGAAPAAPAPPPVDDRADLTVIAEPDNRTPRRWGRRRFETTEADADTGGGAAPKAPRGSGRLYDFMQEDDPDFVDDTTGAIAPATRRSPSRSPRRDRPAALGAERAARRAILLPSLGVALVAVLVFAFGVLGWQVRPVATAAVPDLVGKDLVTAQAAADANGWTVVKNPTRADNTTRGQVLGQVPDPGTGLDAGNVLFVQYSEGLPLVDLPADLTGLSVDQARQQLEGVGLKLGDTLPIASEDVAAGAVVAPAFGVVSPSEKGTVIPLAVSSGPPPRTIPNDLVGKSPADVTRQLKALGLVVAPAEDSSEVIPKGMVKEVDPGSGAQVAKGSQVIVVTSTGPASVTVPDVRGKSVEDAARTLEQAGLVVTGTSGSPSDDVKSTSPKAGTSVKRGTGVTIRS